MAHEPKVEFRKTIDGRHQHVYYTGPRGKMLPLLDQRGDLCDLKRETYGRTYGEVHELVQRITAVCKMPA